MSPEDIKAAVAAQRELFDSGATLDVEVRISALKTLQAWIQANEDRIAEALKADLGKSAQESYMCEVGLVLSEISYMLRHVRGFAREHLVWTPLAQFASCSYTVCSPYGVTLIMSPWNYPFMLTIDPLVDALAAGNTAVLKPSDYSPATSAIISQMVADCFPPEYVCVVQGGRAENTALLDQTFDYIFFTGSKAVGHIVMSHAAEHLTPLTLELGGKSPCIVDATAKINLAARRIVFGKYLNCGQTCVAPDYILVHESVKDAFVAAVRNEVTRQFGIRPLDNPDYGKIVNQKHFDRLRGLIDPEKVVVGGAVNEATLQIAPTVMDNVTLDDAVMGEEIFGPLMPIISYSTLDEALAVVRKHPTPLAFYVFTQNIPLGRKLMRDAGFGGGCINDVVIHLATSEMPFGGFGSSGMGGYHGRAGFDTFSHKKAVVDKKTWMDLPMRYQPYRRMYDAMIRLFLR